MLLRIEGHHLPGRGFAEYDDVHVGLQIRKDVEELVPGDASGASWTTELDVFQTDTGTDFRGPAVQGKRTARFVYLVWVQMSGGLPVMFRRAKLMLDDVPDPNVDTVTVRVHLTDDAGGPRCARLRSTGLRWE